MKKSETLLLSRFAALLAAATVGFDTGGVQLLLAPGDSFGSCLLLLLLLLLFSPPEVLTGVAPEPLALDAADFGGVGGV